MVDIKLVKNKFIFWNFIRKLRNDDEIQKGFIDNIKITIIQQIKYMLKYKNNYYICLKNNKPVGYVGEIDNDIRIAVIKKEQRKGIGIFMINELMKKRPESFAKIKLDNIASKKLFESCGFICINKDNNFYYYKKK